MSARQSRAAAEAPPPPSNVRGRVSRGPRRRFAFHSQDPVHAARRPRPLARVWARPFTMPSVPPAARALPCV